MTEYIEKEAARPDEFCVGVSCQECPFLKDQLYGGCRVDDFIMALQPADVRPVVRGKWVSDEDTYPGPGMRNYKCSACGKIAGTWRKGLKKEQLYPFCPMCGADMRGENNG